jgi:hypothetical protein
MVYMSGTLFDSLCRKEGKAASPPIRQPLIRRKADEAADNVVKIGERSMEWKFWQKAETRANGVKLPGPKELRSHMGMYLVVKRQFDPDWAWELKYVKRPHEGSTTLFDFRLFSPSEAKKAGVRVTNYDALDAHADLILFHGWSDNWGHEFHIDEDSVAKAA